MDSLLYIAGPHVATEPLVNLSRGGKGILRFLSSRSDMGDLGPGLVEGFMIFHVIVLLIFETQDPLSAQAQK